MTRQDLEKYLNLPWVLFSHPADSGAADCFSISAYFYKEELDIDIQYFEDVDENERKLTMGPGLVALITRRYKKFKKDFTEVPTPQLGDLVLWRVGGLVLHLGVMVSEDEQLTATPMNGSSIVKINPDHSVFMRHNSLL